MTDDTRARARALAVPYGVDFVCPLHDTHHDYCDHCVQAKHLVEFAAAIEQPLRVQIEKLKQQRDETTALLAQNFHARTVAQARVQELEQALRMARRAMDNYFSYSPSRRDRMALSAVDTAMRSIKAALASAGGRSTSHD